MCSLSSKPPLLFPQLPQLSFSFLKCHFIYVYMQRILLLLSTTLIIRDLWMKTKLNIVLLYVYVRCWILQWHLLYCIFKAPQLLPYELYHHNAQRFTAFILHKKLLYARFGIKSFRVMDNFYILYQDTLGINTILLYLQHFENEKSVLPYSWIIRKKFKGIVWHFMKYTYSLFALRITWGNPSHSRIRSVDMKLQSTDS